MSSPLRTAVYHARQNPAGVVRYSRITTEGCIMADPTLMKRLLDKYFETHTTEDFLRG
jgi:hypothetical protein